MALESKAKQAAYRDRMRERGFAPITEWIPPESKALVRDICKKLREAKRTTK